MLCHWGMLLWEYAARFNSSPADLDSIYQLRGVEHLEAWLYAAFLHQLICPKREPGEAVAE